MKNTIQHEMYKNWQITELSDSGKLQYDWNIE